MAVGHAKIFRTEVNKHHSNAFLSPKDIREAVLEIKTRGLTNGEATEALLGELEMIEGFSEMKTRFQTFFTGIGSLARRSIFLP